MTAPQSSGSASFFLHHKGYEQWAKIHNLKQAAKTMNFLTEHKIEQYADLVSRIEEMAAESGQAADALKDAEKRLSLIHISEPTRPY